MPSTRTSGAKGARGMGTGIMKNEELKMKNWDHPALGTPSLRAPLRRREMEERCAEVVAPYGRGI